MEIRDFTPDLVLCVQDLLAREYRDYPYPVVCAPEHVSYVAHTGEHVIGFARAKRDDHYAQDHVYEFGTAIVDPRHRVRGAMQALAAHITAEAWERGADWQHTEMVTFVPAIQKVLPRVGFQFCGLELMKHPCLRGEMPQPESVFFALARRDGVLRHTGRLFLPQDLREVIAAYLPSFLREGSDEPIVGAFPDPILHPPYLREGISGSEFLDIGANWVETLPLLDKLRHEGWIFSGVLPGILRTRAGHPCDGIRLQRLPRGLVFDPTLVHALDPQAAILRQHVLRALIS